ncbi:hypothetical protein ACIRG5_36725 [Lentzea sp. NPDC102401]|uniref:hypothetical protein n=1 Tax=Lentzea sp. NPDC102401 TaxID=3364128 RepID=UPI00382A81DD
MHASIRTAWILTNCTLFLFFCTKLSSPRLLLANWAENAWILAACAASWSVYSWFYHLRRIHQKRPKFPRHLVPADRALELQMLAGRRRIITLFQAKVFALAVIEPAQIRQRVVEDYIPERRCIKQSVTVDVQIPYRLRPPNGTEETTTLLLPALVPSKGELHDDLKIFDMSGEAINSYSYRQQLVLLASVLRLLLVSACGVDRLPEHVADLELLALEAMMQRRLDPTDPVDTSTADKIAALDVPNKHVLKIAAELVRKLIANYAIVIATPMRPDRRLQYRHEQILIPELKLTKEGSRRRWSATSAARLCLGARPVDLNIDITNASSCQSYHLHVHGPEGLYLARQEANGMGTMLQRLAANAPTKPHCRFRRRLGQAHAHFYSRYMPTPRPHERPSLRFKYFEVPPGSTLRALVTAAASAAIILLVGFVNSRFPDPGTDAPAFLLTFPALAATWLGFGSPTQRLLEGTMSARVCLLVTAVLSVTSAGLYMAHKTVPNYDWGTLPDQLVFLGVTDPGWAMVGALSVINAAFISFRCFTLTWEYTTLMARKV